MSNPCPDCQDTGGIAVARGAGKLSDIGLCSCPIGAKLRRDLDDRPDRLEQRFGISIDRIWPIEELRSMGTRAVTR